MFKSKLGEPSFLHRFRCEMLFEAAKIHVQIMRFTCCLTLICLHDISRESIAALTDNFSDAFVCKMLCASMKLWWHNNIWKFDTGAILFREIQCKKRDILMFKRRFHCGFGWNPVKFARITITHVCFIALTFARSLGWCLTLDLMASCSNSVLRTRQMLQPGN